MQRNAVNMFEMLDKKAIGSLGCRGDVAKARVWQSIGQVPCTWPAAAAQNWPASCLDARRWSPCPCLPPALNTWVAFPVPAHFGPTPPSVPTLTRSGRKALSILPIPLSHPTEHLFVTTLLLHVLPHPPPPPPPDRHLRAAPGPVPARRAAADGLRVGPGGAAHRAAHLLQPRVQQVHLLRLHGLAHGRHEGRGMVGGWLATWTRS